MCVCACACVCVCVHAHVMCSEDEMLDHSPGFVEALTNNVGTGGSLLRCESEST